MRERERERERERKDGVPLPCAAKSVVFCEWHLELVSERETCFNARYRELKNISFVPKREPTMSKGQEETRDEWWKGSLKGRPLGGKHVLRRESTHKGETSSSPFYRFPSRSTIFPSLPCRFVIL